MSIPKEPRQLMINIMYLVLTVMLAINVSAEIFNAFQVVNKGLVNSNLKLDASNRSMPALIERFSKKDKRYERYPKFAEESVTLSETYCAYVSNLWEGMVTESGGRTPEGQIEGMKDKDVATRVLVQEKNGEILKQKTIALKQQLESIIKQINPADLGKKVSITVDVDDVTWKKSGDKVNWSDFNFRQMPLGALEPMFTKFLHDAKQSEAAILNYLLGQMGASEEIVTGDFDVATSPVQSYLTEGETFQTDLYLTTYSAPQSATGISIAVNGKELPVQQGKATFKAVATGAGSHPYDVVAKVKNPVTGEIKTYTKRFAYEVGKRSVAVGLDKMNVLFLGLENPVSISASGYSSNKLTVKAKGAGLKLTPAGPFKYLATVNSLDPAFIEVYAEGQMIGSYPFRVMAVPDPVPALGKKNTGALSPSEMKAQSGIVIHLPNFYYDVRCKISGFKVTHLSPRKEASEALNSGPLFNEASKRLVQAANFGDTYYFEEITAICPGDIRARKLNSMLFKIK